jgi:hypothetical protein
MSRPDECKWCGCNEIIWDGFPANNGGREVLFGCGSVWHEDAKVWYRDPLRCGGQVGRLYRRIADAIDAARRSIRFALEANSSIQCVLASDMDRVIDILQGNSPEIPDSSNSPANLESST